MLVKGGHLAGGAAAAHADDPALVAAAAEAGQGVVTDVLFDGKSMVELSAPWIRCGSVEAGSCTFDCLRK